MENSNWKPIKDYQPPIGHILVTIKISLFIFVLGFECGKICMVHEIFK